MKTALITGISGFSGSHLAEYCLNCGCEVHGTYYRSDLSDIAEFRDRIHLHRCDVRSRDDIDSIVQKIAPDLVFHLAAQASVPTSWRDPSATIAINVEGTANLLEALRGTDARLHIASSSEVYGSSFGAQALNENAKLSPQTPYGLSKMAQDLLGEQYHRAYDMYIVRTRAFNHTGPRLGELYVTSNFARQIAMIECGFQEPVLSVGNLSARRNYTDVRDIVRAYWLSLQSGCKSGEVYNICGDLCISIGDILDKMVAMSKAKIEVRVDVSRLRPVDIPIVDGDSTRFRRATGWKPTIPFEQTLEDLLEYWRHKLSRG